ncbi:hypothetical protein H8E65_00190 [Candidatus Bathyarchaeota archaeon]|nr:hypothetical protein [Candidatus Bathyarchaeota archaeon]
MIDLSKRKILIVLSSLAIVIVSGLSYVLLSTPRFEESINSIDPRDMGVEEWLKDFEYLYNLVQENYPYLPLKERTHGYNWLDLRAVFEERIRNASDNEDFLYVIMEAVEALQNRHTHVLDPGTVIEYHSLYKGLYPMNIVFSDEVAEAADYWFEHFERVYERKYLSRFEVRIVYDRGDYIITDSQGNPLPRMGVKVTKVDGVLIDEAVKTCFDREYLDWDFMRNKTYLWRISPYEFGGDAAFTVLDSIGNEVDLPLHPSYGPSSISGLYPPSDFIFKKHEEESVGYMYIGTFDPSTVGSHEDDILDFYGAIENYDYLIIDIRGNTGGGFSSWVECIVKPLIKDDVLHEYYLAYRTGEYIQWFHDGYLGDKAPVSKVVFRYLPPEVQSEDYEIYNFSMTYTPTQEVDFVGKIVLLTDFMVYSAAEGFTNFCKQTGFATIYGTPSGGDGFFIWPIYCVLPNSKIAITMTSSMSLDYTGHANEQVRTQPDIYHETAFMDHDELVKFVLDEIRGNS